MSNELEITRSGKKKRSDPFEYCKWAPGDWAARFYANTAPHEKSRANTIKRMVSDPAWFRMKMNEDIKMTSSDNKARGSKRPRGRVKSND